MILILAVLANAADYHSMKMGLIPGKKIFGADVARQANPESKLSVCIGDRCFVSDLQINPVRMVIVTGQQRNILSYRKTSRKVL